MPLIPVANQQMEAGPLHSPVPAQKDPAAAAYSGQIAEQAGNELIKFGNAQLQTKRDLDVAEGTDAINQASLTSFNNAKQTGAADGSDLSTLYSSSAQPQIDDILNNYSDPVVSARLKSHAAIAQNDMNTQIQSTSMSMLQTNNLQRIGNQANLSADRIGQAPDSANLFESETQHYGALLDQAVNAGTIGSVEAEQARQSFYKQAALSRLDGWYRGGSFQNGIRFLSANQETPDVNTTLDPDKASAMGLITSEKAAEMKAAGQDYTVPVMTKGKNPPLTPTESNVINSLDPGTKSRLLDQFTNAVADKQKVNLSDLADRVRDYTTMANAGSIDPTDPGNQQEVQNMLQDIRTSGLPQDKQRRMMDPIMGASVVAQKIPLMATMPVSKLGNLKEDASSEMSDNFDIGQTMSPISDHDFVKQALDQKIQGLLDKNIESSIKERNDDSADFIIGSNPQAANLYKASMSGNPADAQRYAKFITQSAKNLEVNPENINILPNDAAATMASQIQGIGDSGATATKMNQLETQWGKSFPKVWSELAESNKAVAALDIARFAPPETRANLIDGIKNAPAIKTAFSSEFGEQEEYKTKAINDAINATPAGQLNKVYLGGTDNSQSLAYTNALKMGMQLQMKEEITHNPSLSVSDAADKAYKDIIGVQQQIVQTDKGTLLVQKTIGGLNIDPNYIAAYANVYTQPENLKDLGVAVPQTFAKNPDAFYENLSKTCRWAMTPKDMSGVQLLAPSAKTGRLTPVTDGKGVPVIRSFQDMNGVDQKTQDYLRGFGGRMFDKVTKAVGSAVSGANANQVMTGGVPLGGGSGGP